MFVFYFTQVSSSACVTSYFINKPAWRHVSGRTLKLQASILRAPKHDALNSRMQERTLKSWHQVTAPRWIQIPNLFFDSNCDGLQPTRMQMIWKTSCVSPASLLQESNLFMRYLWCFAAHGKYCTAGICREEHVLDVASARRTSTQETWSQDPSLASRLSSQAWEGQKEASRHIRTCLFRLNNFGVPRQRVITICLQSSRKAEVKALDCPQAFSLPSPPWRCPCLRPRQRHGGKGCQVNVVDNMFQRRKLPERSVAKNLEIVCNLTMWNDVDSAVVMCSLVISCDVWWGAMSSGSDLRCPADVGSVMWLLVIGCCGFMC